MGTTIPVVTSADIKWCISKRTYNTEDQGMVPDIFIPEHTELCEFGLSTKVYSASANN